MTVAELAKKQLNSLRACMPFGASPMPCQVEEALKALGADVLASALREVREEKRLRTGMTEFSEGAMFACERIAARLEKIRA